MRKTPLEEKLLKDFLKVKKEYEKYFKTLEKPDAQALSAYGNILKNAVELTKKLRPEGKSTTQEDMKRIAEEILESEYGIKRN
jgi:hypothetical protein